MYYPSKTSNYYIYTVDFNCLASTNIFIGKIINPISAVLQKRWQFSQCTHIWLHGDFSPWRSFRMLVVCIALTSLSPLQNIAIIRICFQGSKEFVHGYIMNWRTVSSGSYTTPSMEIWGKSSTFLDNIARFLSKMLNHYFYSYNFHFSFSNIWNFNIIVPHRLESSSTTISPTNHVCDWPTLSYSTCTYLYFWCQKYTRRSHQQWVNVGQRLSEIVW